MTKTDPKTKKVLSRTKTYDPPKSERLSAVWLRNEDAVSVEIAGLRGDESLPEDSREMLRVTVR